MEKYSILGLVAGLLTTVSFFPQALKTWRSKSARDISLNMFLIFCTGVALWLVYGILIMDIAIILSNIFTLILASSILYFKLKYPD